MKISCYFFLSLFFLSSAAFIARAETIENSGFVPGNLWFSKEPSSVGETVKIYTLVWNSSKEDITGSVVFFDNETQFGKQTFVLAGEGSSKVLSAPWTAGEGYHKIYAEISGSFAASRGGSAVEVSLQYAKTEEEEQFIKTSQAVKLGKPTSSVSSFVGEKVGFAKGYLETNLPAPIVGTAKSAVSDLERGRVLGESWNKQAVTNLKNYLDSSRQNNDDSPSKWLGTERPLKYAAMFLLSVAEFVFGNAWLFYGLFIVLLFFVLRFVKRKFFF